MFKFTFKPYDVLYFGGGKTLKIAQSVESIFPPYPHTFAGAISKKVGKSYPLKRIYGVFLYNEKEQKYYFPKPENIFKPRKAEKFEKCFLVRPTEDRKFFLFNPENTNKPSQIKELPLYFGEEDIEPFSGFISEEGLINWIEGRVIEKKEIKTFAEIFEYEPRVGIKQSLETHAVEGKESVYRISFLWLKPEWNFVVFVEFKDEVKEEAKKVFSSPPFSLKLGGEMKAVHYKVEEVDINEVFKRLKSACKESLHKAKNLRFITLSPYEWIDKVVELNIEVVSLVQRGFCNLSLSSPLVLNKTDYVKKAFPAGTVIFGKIKNESLVTKKWLVFSEGSEFFGANLMLIAGGW